MKLTSTITAAMMALAAPAAADQIRMHEGQNFTVIATTDFRDRANNICQLTATEAQFVITVMADGRGTLMTSTFHKIDKVSKRMVEVKKNPNAGVIAYVNGTPYPLKPANREFGGTYFGDVAEYTTFGLNDDVMRLLHEMRAGAVVNFDEGPAIPLFGLQEAFNVFTDCIYVISN